MNYLYSETPTTKLYLGHAAKVLETLDSESVNCVVTSPPYFGLRDYGSATWIGGDENCDHTIEVKTEQDFMHTLGKINRVFRGDRTKCLNCKAIREDEQIGLEATPEKYVENMIQIFREVKRVMAKDGTLWLNLGDTYAGAMSRASNNGRAGYGNPREEIVKRISGNLKPKDLIGIPWKVAFALQADGWYLRQDIIWSKPAPMPESVTDRCTKSHEYIFLLSKSAKYYYDHESIKEKAKGERWSGNKPINMNNTKDTDNQFSGLTRPRKMIYDKRNKRDVWSINTASYKEAHFAVFPEEIPMNCIKAGTKVGDVVLDPFAGSGTTLLVAQKLNRKSVGIDIKNEYLDMCLKRTKQLNLL